MAITYFHLYVLVANPRNSRGLWDRHPDIDSVNRILGWPVAFKKARLAKRLKKNSSRSGEKQKGKNDCYNNILTESNKCVCFYLA